MPNLALEPQPNQSAYRRIAAVAWDPPRDPHVYGSMQIRAEKLEAWIAKKRQETGERITVNHAVVRALAMIMARHRELNSLVRLSSLQQRRDIDIFVQVVVEDETSIGKADLSGVKIKQADRLDVAGIAKTVRERAAKIRAKQDEDFERTKGMTAWMPGWLLRMSLRFIDFVGYTLNLDTKMLGAPPDPFGSAMVTNVGVFGLTVGYAPFFPFARCPIIITLGALEEAPVVEDGRVVVGRVLHINGTFDHRIVDGYHAGVIARECRALLEDPDRLDAVA
jgi:pyruvate/2-oxoglutarate dehydrogenase complex dihydrolipoamide acyltransferase (E2) component